MPDAFEIDLHPDDVLEVKMGDHTWGFVASVTARQAAKLDSLRRRPDDVDIADALGALGDLLADDTQRSTWNDVVLDYPVQALFDLIEWLQEQYTGRPT